MHFRLLISTREYCWKAFYIKDFVRNEKISEPFNVWFSFDNCFQNYMPNIMHEHGNTAKPKWQLLSWLIRINPYIFQSECAIKQVLHLQNMQQLMRNSRQRTPWGTCRYDKFSTSSICVCSIFETTQQLWTHILGEKCQHWSIFTIIKTLEIFASLNSIDRRIIHNIK